MRSVVSIGLIVAFTVTFTAAPCAAVELEPLKHNNPGLIVDLGVGLWAWPVPMDYDGDGDFDLIVSCPDKPFNGTYLFENPGGDAEQPVFKAPVRLGKGYTNFQGSYVDGKPRVLIPGAEITDTVGGAFENSSKIYKTGNVHPNRVRANQWRYVDYDGDKDLDLIVGVGDWTDYGWDDAYNQEGVWTNGPLHGYVYLLANAGSDQQPKYEEPSQLTAGDKPIDNYGMPSPNFADFDGDGDLELLCGEFLDGFTYYQNTGTRTAPQYAVGRRLESGGKPLHMDLEMITPTAFDWDRDGDMDLICGDEDGRVALIEHTGQVADGLPRFLPPVYFKQQADDVKFGALATPVGVDWDGDGDDDLIVGNSAGYISFIENLDGGNPPRWAAPKLLKAGGETIRIQAGPNGSIQGPCEAKWGYTVLDVADWNDDGLPDLITNSIWGAVEWYENQGPREKPELKAARPIEVEWSGETPKPEWVWWTPRGKQLVTQWRTSPCVRDVNGDRLLDLVMLDTEGCLALFRRERRGSSLVLLPPERVFLDAKGEPLRPNPNRAGKSGRRTFTMVDWDRDGRQDLIFDGLNAELWRNVGTAGEWKFENRGPVSERRLAGHSTRPTIVDFNRDGQPELVVGAEDGRFYHGVAPTQAAKP